MYGDFLLIYMYTITLLGSIDLSVFDKLIWCTIGPKSFLFGTAQFSLLASGADNYDCIVTNIITFLLIGSNPMVHTLANLEPIWSQFGPCFKAYQKL